jgi:hypothetical protein
MISQHGLVTTCSATTPTTTRNSRLETVPNTPPSCTNIEVTDRHQSPCIPAGVRSRCPSTPGNTNCDRFTVAVTTNTDAVTSGNRWSPYLC